MNDLFSDSIGTSAMERVKINGLRYLIQWKRMQWFTSSKHIRSGVCMTLLVVGTHINVETSGDAI